MAEPKQNGASNRIVSFLLLVVVGLGGWNLAATHTIAKEVAALSQKVEDGKQTRLEFQLRTDARLTTMETELRLLGVQLALSGISQPKAKGL